MRTKKILSILLVMIMALGMTVIGVSATELADNEEVAVLADGAPAADLEDEEAAAPADAVPAAALVGDEEADVQADGWDAVTAITLYENKYHSRGAGSVEVKWDTFRAKDGTTTGTDSFYKLYESGKASLTWEVEREINEVWTGQGIAANPTAAGASSGIFVDSVTSTTVTLVIGQHNTNKWYGRVRARLTVTVNGQPRTSDWFYAELTDSKTFAEKIADAEEELAKTDRYTEHYINNLKAIVSDAKLILAGKPNEETVAAYVTYLENGIAGKTALGEPVGNIWKLTDKNGENFIDELLGQDFLRIWWRISDIIATIQTVTEPMFAFFGQIGDFFGNIAPFFTWIFGLLMP